MVIENNSAHFVAGAVSRLFWGIGIHRAVSRSRFRASRLARKHGNYIHYQYFPSALRTVGDNYVDDRYVARTHHPCTDVPNRTQFAGRKHHSGKNRNAVLVDVFVAGRGKHISGDVAQPDTSGRNGNAHIRQSNRRSNDFRRSCFDGVVKKFSANVVIDFRHHNRAEHYLQPAGAL